MTKGNVCLEDSLNGQAYSYGLPTPCSSVVVGVLCTKLTYVCNN